MKATRVLALSLAIGSLTLINLPGAGAQAPDDFPLGRNGEDQPCRAQTRFGPESAGRRLDVYCGGWERPSGSLTVLPQARADAALARLREDCGGDGALLTAAPFDELRQVQCTGPNGLRRYGLLARRGGDVLIGSAYPADWGPLVQAARVMIGAAAPAAAEAPLNPSTPGLDQIRAVFPDGPPGQGAENNYELLRRRAYERNALWEFGASERDYSELLQAHRRVSPQDVAGEAEILAEIGLNLSGARRFFEADEALTQAQARAAQASDPLLASKVMNYRAIDLMNQQRYAEALQMAQRANAARAALIRDQQRAGGFRVTAADARAASVRRGARSVLLAPEGLGEADRATILSAQGYYVAGSAARALRRPEALGELERAGSLLASTRAPPPWLTALIRGELAMAQLDRGDVGAADAAVQGGLDTIRAAAPGSRAEGYLLLVAARAQRRAGQAERALATGATAVGIFARQRETPGLPADLADEHLDALYAAWSRARNPALAAQYFEATALVWDGAAARSAAQLAARLATGEASEQARAFQDAERAYRAALARRQRANSAPETRPEEAAAAEDGVRQSSARLASAEEALRARSPRYLELLTPHVAAADLQAVLAPDEGYLRIVLSSAGGQGVLVTRAGVTPFPVSLTREQAERLATRVRDTSAIQRRRLPDYDLQAANDLYRALIGPVEAELAGLRSLQIDAPGALAAVSFAALVTTLPTAEQTALIADQQDYSGVAWLARRTAVASSVGPASFVRLRRVQRPQQPLRAAAFGDFTPAPAEVARRLAAGRSLSARCAAEITRVLGRLPRLPSTADEARATAQMFGTASRISLGEAFTDADFFAADEVARADVVLLATHGVLGLSDCFPEPALLASVGDGGDGLIEASELLERRLSAQLVVLSACDTAGGGRADVARTGLSDGGEALSGLARGFLYAGAASVLATQWQVDTTTSAAETRRFFEAALAERAPLARALGEAQRHLYDTPETTHPFYWAGFVLIGDGAIILNSGTATTAAARPGTIAALSPPVAQQVRAHRATSTERAYP